MNLIVKCGWGLCLILLGRLLFTTGGIIDFWRMQQRLHDRYNYLLSLQQENKELTLEIERIGQDPGLQKKLARDNLGVIAKDEFLVIFAEDSMQNSKRGQHITAPLPMLQ